MSAAYSCNIETFTDQMIELTYADNRFCEIAHVSPGDTTKVLRLQVELTMATKKSEPSQMPVATSLERFDENKLLKDLQQLANDDQSLDCTIVATKDYQEIKLGILKLEFAMQNIFD